MQRNVRPRNVRQRAQHRRSRTPRQLATLAGAAFLVVSCGGSSETGSAPAPAPTTATVSATGDAPSDDAATVPAALQFAAPLVGGGEIDASTLADKPTVFWFWAPT